MVNSYVPFECARKRTEIKQVYGGEQLWKSSLLKTGRHMTHQRYIFGNHVKRTGVWDVKTLPGYMHHRLSSLTLSNMR